MNEGLTAAGIPYAVNADTQFYDRDRGSGSGKNHPYWKKH